MKASLNMAQIDIKSKTCDIETWTKHLFLDISFTNTDTLVPSLYQCIETRSREVFWLLSQPLRIWSYFICNFRTLSREFLDPVVNRFTQQIISTEQRELFL
jgi:hypothetical protein